ncbi:MAG: NAD-dependent epimerase/dehydratase family protein [Spirochaetota bacterium]
MAGSGSPKIVFITGANGFIGSHLARYLAGRGYRVRGLVRKDSDRSLLSDVPLEAVTGDLFDREALAEGMEGCDTVYHVAGVVDAADPSVLYRVNDKGTRNVVAAARLCPGLGRFLHVSSISVMGPSLDGRLQDESSPLRPVTHYGRSKLRGEQAVTSSDLPWTVVRPTNILGPGQEELFGLLDALRNGIKPLIGRKEKQTTICFVDDLVRGMVLAAESPAALGKIYIIASREAYGFRELLDLAQELLGRRRVLPLPYPVLYATALIMKTSAVMRGLKPPIDPVKLRQTRKHRWLHDPSAIERDLGFSARTPVAEGLRRIIDHYQTRGWWPRA